eukprot:479688-Pleurochrysis_carterae.AAC.5
MRNAPPTRAAPCPVSSGMEQTDIPFPPANCSTTAAAGSGPLTLPRHASDTLCATPPANSLCCRKRGQTTEVAPSQPDHGCPRIVRKEGDRPRRAPVLLAGIRSSILAGCACLAVKGSSSAWLKGGSPVARRPRCRSPLRTACQARACCASRRRTTRRRALRRWGPSRRRTPTTARACATAAATRRIAQARPSR